MLWKKINDHTVNTTPNHLPSKMDALPKTFDQIILVAEWLVRYYNSVPQTSTTPLPSLAPEPWPSINYILLRWTSSLNIRSKIKGHPKNVKIRSDISLAPNLVPHSLSLKTFSRAAVRLKFR